MAKSNNSKTKWLWLSVLILFVCVAATTIAITSRLNNFLIDDSGAISLITDSDATDTQSQITSSTTPQKTEPPKKPGFEVSDDKTVWNTNTQVEIFRVSYENGEQKITVQSTDGDKVIAPGTENSYIFKLKNTGNVALDYTVEMDAYFNYADNQVPIKSRLNRYDGKWVVGGKDEYAEVMVLDSAKDNATLGAGKYTYYTLDWLWPFESGNAELDTKLGNLAAEQEITFTIVINTTATESDDPNADGGITPPQTGDNTTPHLWIALFVGSLVLMLFLIIYLKKERRRDSAEAETVEKS